MEPTDQTTEQPSAVPDDVRALAITLADRLDNEDPDLPITVADRLALCYELTRGDEPHYSALRKVSDEPWQVSTRAEYAARLRARAAEIAQPSLADRFAAAAQASRDIARQIGAGYDEHPRWRAAERTADDLWSLARNAGYSVNALVSAAAAALKAGDA